MRGYEVLLLDFLASFFLSHLVHHFNDLGQNPSVHSSIVLLTVSQRSFLPIRHLLFLAKLLTEYPLTDSSKAEASVLFKIWIHGFEETLNLHKVRDTVEKFIIQKFF